MKTGTPTMGGALFSGITVGLTVVFNIVSGRHYSQLLTAGSLASSSFLGALDDRLTTVRAGSAGMRARFKLLHNHLQLVGWHENQITQRFWIVSMICAVAGVALAFS
ncbi:MAG: hypothetical protein ACR2JC_13950 [Chloroflexota bacterium]